MTSDTPTTSLKPMIITTWVFLLLASSIPTIILRELFHQNVSEDLRFAMAANVILAGLAMTLIWNAVRSLRPFFLLFLFMVGFEWFVFTKLDQLPFYQTAVSTHTSAGRGRAGVPNKFWIASKGGVHFKAAVSITEASAA